MVCAILCRLYVLLCCFTTTQPKAYMNDQLNKGMCRSGFLSHLHSLSSLLCVCQQLDGDGPAVLYSVLQVNEGVAHVTAHAALSTDRHGAGFTEEQEHLPKQRGG